MTRQLAAVSSIVSAIHRVIWRKIANAISQAFRCSERRTSRKSRRVTAMVIGSFRIAIPHAAIPAVIETSAIVESMVAFAVAYHLRVPFSTSE